MKEIVRFRIARAPQRLKAPTETHLALTYGPTLEAWLGSDVLLDKARVYLEELKLIRPAQRFRHPNADIAASLAAVRRVDDILVMHGNRVAWPIIEAALGGDDDDTDHHHDNGNHNGHTNPKNPHRDRGGDLRTTAPMDTAGLREALSLTLVAAAVQDVTPALRNDVLRLLLVIGLLELAAENANLDAEAVFAALRWRVVLLPSRLLDVQGVRRSLLVRSPGFSDLYVVREEWARYEAGEIAHIENVLKGELKDRLLERTEEQETTTTTETDVTRFEEKDSQTTDRFELSQEAEREATSAFHTDGKVETSTLYGPTHIDTQFGATFDYSVTEAERRAVTQAREIVTRAVNRIEERVRQQRVARTLKRVHSVDKHELDNKQGNDHVVGVYRWVDKIKTVQVFKYPHRLLLEFQVPEPGAFLRWLHTRPKNIQGEVPVSLTMDGKASGTPITADLITASQEANKINYLDLGRRYSAQGLTPPPTDRSVFGTVTHPEPDNPSDEGGNKAPVYATSTISVPDGWEGYSFRIYAVATNDVPEGPGKPTGWVEVVVGTDFPSMTSDDNDPQAIWRFQGVNVFRDMKTMNFRTPVTGQVPVVIATDDLSGMALSVQLFCRPTETALRKWRSDTFDIIQGAYWELQRQYEQNVAQEAMQAGIAIKGDSPARNAEVMREELKRLVVELLGGTRFEGRSALTAPTDGEHPRIDFDKVEAFSAEIQFVEQAFEWENMSFVLYPYYWANSDKWAELQGIESSDPDFDRFLRAGSARVVLPARPGFEFAALLYTKFGTIWGGGPAPMPDTELYLSIADEIRAQQMPPKDGEPGEWWEVRLPTTLVHVSPQGTRLPLDNTAAELPKDA